MADIQNFHDEEEIELYGSRDDTIFDNRLTTYAFMTIWTFDVPLDERSHELVSRVIRTRYDDNLNFAWRLSYIKVGRENDYNNFTISLLSFDKRHLEVCVRCYINEGSCTKKLTEERCFDFGSEPPIQKEFTLWDSDLQRVYQERLVDFLRKGENHLYKIDTIRLKIRVEFEFMEMNFHVCASLKLADDLEAFLQHNDELADVTFEIGGKELKAHKCILAARSPAFAKMFKMREKRDRYPIEDIEPDVFRHLLNFIYSGKTDDARSCNKLSELKLAAEKYELRV